MTLATILWSIFGLICPAYVVLIFAAMAHGKKLDQANEAAHKQETRE